MGREGLAAQMHSEKSSVCLNALVPPVSRRARPDGNSAAEAYAICPTAGAMAEASSRGELFRRKEELEAEIGGIVSALEDDDKGPGLRGNLMADDGFPRADIDIYAVRNMRHRLAQLQTDHQRVMKQIEALLFSGEAFRSGSVASDFHCGPCALSLPLTRAATAMEATRRHPPRQRAGEQTTPARPSLASTRSFPVRCSPAPTCHRPNYSLTHPSCVTP